MPDTKGTSTGTSFTVITNSSDTVPPLLSLAIIAMVVSPTPTSVTVMVLPEIATVATASLLLVAVMVSASLSASVNVLVRSRVVEPKLSSKVWSEMALATTGAVLSATVVIVQIWVLPNSAVTV